MRYTEFSRNKKENEMKRIKREEAQRTGIAYLPSKLFVSGNASVTATTSLPTRRFSAQAF